MKVHEYQAKQLFKLFGVPVPKGNVAETPGKAFQVAEELGYPCVIKAQVHAGGRGKAGGVKLARNSAEAKQYAETIVGMKLVSPQTGPEGRLVRTVLVEQGLAIVKELYLAIIIDREREMPVIMASTEGGMEIEEVAARTPELIHKVHVHPLTGLREYHTRQLIFKLNLNPTQAKNFTVLVRGLFQLFEAKDASLVEINPLVITSTDEVVALDGKINFDDNGLFRHTEIAALRDTNEEAPLEVQASKYDLNYIKLDGNIGCMVNGAGLAMATMDIIKYYGGEPANFLDVGGGASEERVREAFKILLSDANTRGVFVNIFGGIVRTDLVARGIVNAVKGMDIKAPIVIRLVGTNEEEGRRIIQESGMNVVAETSLPLAAQKIVELCKGFVK
ncbi:MAG: ADP-forming succinate--CoA ligase subunit beta [Acidobacteria bacterium]|jgi:succinyl-CoA synthetase beta subunit|nr:ADP-forming succinate--CoA ligase subunit beta [Acidobacteriota bacterium]